MKLKNLLMIALAASALASTVAKADAFDDKERAAATQQEQAAESKAYAAKVKSLNSDNATMLRRVPRGAAITGCYNYTAFIYRNESNGCRLENIQWNGITVEICSEDYDQNLPPEIVDCHYHVAKTNQDCEIVRNPGIKPRCY